MLDLEQAPVVKGKSKKAAAKKKGTTKKTPGKKKTPTSSAAAVAAANTSSAGGGTGPGQARDVGLTVRVEINLPADGDQETYDRIFKSIRENLIDVG